MGEFFDLYKIQPHYLPANGMATLSSLVVFTEGYLGIAASRDIFSKYFNLTAQKVPDPSKAPADKAFTEVGCAMIKPRKHSRFVRIKTPDSVKGWHRTWFYVKNANNSIDGLNLPEYSSGPPPDRGWDYYPAEDGPDVVAIENWLTSTHIRLLMTYFGRGSPDGSHLFRCGPM